MYSCRVCVQVNNLKSCVQLKVHFIKQLENIRSQAMQQFSSRKKSRYVFCNILMVRKRFICNAVKLYVIIYAYDHSAAPSAMSKLKRLQKRAARTQKSDIL